MVKSTQLHHHPPFLSLGCHPAVFTLAPGSAAPGLCGCSTEPLSLSHFYWPPLPCSRPSSSQVPHWPAAADFVPCCPPVFTEYYPLPFAGLSRCRMEMPCPKKPFSPKQTARPTVRKGPSSRLREGGFSSCPTSPQHLALAACMFFFFLTPMLLHKPAMTKVYQAATQRHTVVTD